MILDNCNYSKCKKKNEVKYIKDIPNLENYLALYLCIKGTKETGETKKKRYLTSAEALRLMGLDVKECRKVP